MTTESAEYVYPVQLDRFRGGVIATSPKGEVPIPNEHLETASLALAVTG